MVKNLPVMQDMHPWVEKIPWRMVWQPTPVLLPREFHGQKFMGSQRVGHD